MKKYQISNIKYQKYTKNKVILIFSLIFLIYYLFKSVTASVFLKGKDKINVVFYGENTRFYSMDMADTDYILTYSSEAKILIPGGYGKYRLGGIGKLSYLDHDPGLIKRALSSATSSFVDLYYYSNSNEIFYDNLVKEGLFPTFKEFFWSKSNANIVDRLFVFMNLSNRNKNFYKIINIDNDFSEESFSKKFQGSFYSKVLRGEGENLQIRYSKSYASAKLISRIIEGEGIRVVDLNQSAKDVKSCSLIVNNNKEKSKTTRTLADFFHCKVISGETEVSDIILELGDLEEKWAVE